jgi:Zn-dependent M28 family amino/carboxypeptidase
VVVGAHYDSAGRSPGANDNATGCALALAVARHLKGLPHRSKNVLVVLFDQEERGLRGSQAFARKLLEEGRRVVAVHAVDQMGWDADGDGVVEVELPYEGGADLYREAAGKLGRTVTVHVTEEPGSDHSAFRRRGMPALGVTEEYRNGDTAPHIQRPTDGWDTVDFQYLAHGTLLVQTALALLVRRPG